VPTHIYGGGLRPNVAPPCIFRLCSFECKLQHVRSSRSTLMEQWLPPTAPLRGDARLPIVSRTAPRALSLTSLAAVLVWLPPFQRRPRPLLLRRDEKNFCSPPHQPALHGAPTRAEQSTSGLCGRASVGGLSAVATLPQTPALVGIQGHMSLTGWSSWDVGERSGIAASAEKFSQRGVRRGPP